MTITYKQAIQSDICDVLLLEQDLFGNKPSYKPEIREGYEKFLELGGIINLQYVDGKLNAILESIDTCNLNASILELPEDSPFRMNYESGRLNGRNGQWIYEFAGIGSQRSGLYREFRKYTSAFGFVPLSNNEAVTAFLQVFSVDGIVPNIYNSDEADVVFVHPKMISVSSHNP